MALEAWERLGELLVARRVELGYPNRTKFAKAKGLKDTRIIAAAENVERQNFESATIALIEHTYEWEPGSIRSVLSGGPPTLKPDIVYVEEIPAPERTETDRAVEIFDPTGKSDDEVTDWYLREMSRRRGRGGQRERFDDEHGAAGEENQDSGGPE